MSTYTFFFVPTILFLTIVAPLWITLHYRSKKRSELGLSEHERQQLEDLLMKLDKIIDRVDALEKILDDDQPTWRSSPGESTRAQPTSKQGGQ